MPECLCFWALPGGMWLHAFVWCSPELGIIPLPRSAGPKRKLVPTSAAKPAGLAARAGGGSVGRPAPGAALAPPAAKRSKVSVKARLTKKLGLGKKR